jgi:hypothetical protein
MKIQKVSSLRLPLDYRHYQHLPQQQAYSLNTTSPHSSGLPSTPFSSSGMRQGSIPDLNSYHEAASLNIYPTATGTSLLPPFVVRDAEPDFNGRRSLPSNKTRRGRLSHLPFQDITAIHNLTVTR